MKGTPTYRVWSGMMTRCRNPRSKDYARYGGAGITICDSWINFANFFADMGVRPDGMSIDRIDNAVGYQPGNCRWVNAEEQANNRTNNVNLTLDGVTKSVCEWSRHLDINVHTIYRRLARGWSAEKTLTTPVMSQFNSKKITPA